MENVEVQIYQESSYNIENFIDNNFGGYNNSVFYDYTKLFFIILICVVLFRVVSLIFGSK